MPYGKFQDMLKLVEMMQAASPGLTLDEIIDEFGVSRRTAERMRDAIHDHFGTDFETKPDGPRRYFKLRSRWLDGLTLAFLASLSEGELAAFPMAGKILRQNNLAAQAETLERVFIGLKSLMKPKTKFDINLEDLMKSEGIALRPGPKITYDEGIVRVLREALGSFHQVRVAYVPGRAKKAKDYTLIPFGFLYGERDHYLVARHADGFRDSLPRYFILSRIKAVEKLEAKFKEDPGFNLAEYAAHSFGVYQEEPVKVEWLFSPEVADKAANYVFHPTQTLTRNKDGSLTVKFKAGGRLEMAWHLYTWGDKVKVVKPADFWDKLPEPYGRPSWED
jgi:predicted DNA-binding transcriptional regulator YafY